MNTLRRALTIALLVAPLFACTRRMGKLPFAGEGTEIAVLPLAAGTVEAWTQLDVMYEGPAKLGYHIELLQAGSRVAVMECDALEELPTKVGWVELQSKGRREVRGSGRMACSASLPKAGPTEVRATLAFGTRPLTATLKKVDLVVTQ